MVDTIFVMEHPVWLSTFLSTFHICLGLHLMILDMISECNAWCLGMSWLHRECHRDCLFQGDESFIIYLMRLLLKTLIKSSSMLSVVFETCCARCTRSTRAISRLRRKSWITSASCSESSSIFQSGTRTKKLRNIFSGNHCVRSSQTHLFYFTDMAQTLRSVLYMGAGRNNPRVIIIITWMLKFHEMLIDGNFDITVCYTKVYFL